MTEQQRQLLATVLDAIGRYERGQIEVAEVQNVVESALRLLERDNQTLIDELRDCETDLEFVRFATPNEQQRDVAIARLERTKEAVNAAIQ